MRSRSGRSAGGGDRIHVGTSGWAYREFQGLFYPPKLRTEDRLSFYAQNFDIVELNNSFYRLPSQETFSHWAASTPDHFRFAVKASRYLTHILRLKDPEEPLARMMDSVSALGHKRGPILFQLPPRFRLDLPRLDAFLKALKPYRRRGARFVIEFRDPSWDVPEVHERLSRAGVSWCIFELVELHSSPTVTSDLVYIRLHGREGKYKGAYRGALLERWAEALEAWARSGLDCYIFFDNTMSGDAVLDALELKRMLFFSPTLPRAA